MSSKDLQVQFFIRHIGIIISWKYRGFPRFNHHVADFVSDNGFINAFLTPEVEFTTIEAFHSDSTTVHTTVDDVVLDR